MTLLVIILAICILFYYLKVHYEYWQKRGVPGPKPTLLLGNTGESLLMKKSLFDIYAEIYNEYKKFPFVGTFQATTPSLLICDPELIKDMTVKSFHHFHDNDLEVDKEKDPIFGRNPFVLKGEEWKIVRSQLTPGFTSGKMKGIYPLLEETGREMVTFLEKQSCYDAKKLCSKFTLNNVANIAFGVDAQSFTHEISEFQDIANKVFQSSFIQNILFLLTFAIPPTRKFIKIKFINKEVEERMTNLVKQTLKYREENKIVRNDFLQILTQLKTTCKEYDFTDIDVTAHASTFFFDGYETSAGVMSFVLYQLASNPEIQSQLREELSENFENNKIPYDVLQKLPYLDAVLNETLRMHPPLFALSKICTKEYTYVPKKGDGITKPVIIEEGTSIILPLSGLHFDPDFFEDPQVFNPDRFMGDNKEKIKKYAFLPFGEGPRACLGQRFGVLQIKIGVSYILKNFELSVNEKTKVPLEYDPIAFITTPKGGLWINFEKI